MTPGSGAPGFEPGWAAHERVRALITTRDGGVSRGPFAGFNLADHVGDDAEAVAANRRALRERLPSEPRWLRQVHGAQVYDADAHPPGTPIEADAAVTRSAGSVLAVLTADCLPILLCDDAATVVGIAHAGWRGLAGGVIEATISAMRIDPERLIAHVGPGIGAAVYEVGDEVRDAFSSAGRSAAHAFVARGEDAPGKYLADLSMLARQRLGRAGVMRVSDSAQCTWSDPQRFFSARRDQVTGRFASLIWMEAGP